MTTAPVNSVYHDKLKTLGIKSIQTHFDPMELTLIADFVYDKQEYHVTMDDLDKFLDDLIVNMKVAS